MLTFSVIVLINLALSLSAPADQYGNWEAQLKTTNPAEKVRVVAKTMMNHFTAISHTVDSISSTLNMNIQGKDFSKDGKYQTSHGHNPSQTSGSSTFDILSGFVATTLGNKQLNGYLYGLASEDLKEYIHDLAIMKTGTPFQWLNTVTHSSLLKKWLKEPLLKSPVWREVTFKAMMTSPRQRILNAIVFDMEKDVSLQDFMAVAMDHSSYDNSLIEAMATNTRVQQIMELAVDKKTDFGTFVKLLTGKALNKFPGYQNNKYEVKVNEEVATYGERGFAAGIMFVLNNFSDIMHGFEVIDSPQRNFNSLVDIMSHLDMTAMNAVNWN